MYSKIKCNNSFGETTRYVVDKEKAQILGGTIAGTDSATITREFSMSRDVNPNIARPVYHLMLSYSYSDKATQDLTNDKLFDLAVRNFSGLVVSARQPELLKDENSSEYETRVNEFMESDLFQYQFFVARHHDTEHQHTHLVASRVNLDDGHAIPTYKDHYRTQLVCRKLERDFGLQQLQNSWEIEKRKPSRAQTDKTKAGYDVEIQSQIQNAIDRIASQQPGMSFEEFVRALETDGVEVKVRESENQKGLSYAMQGVAFRASKLGQNYTYSGLQQTYGIDQPVPEQAQTLEPETSQPEQFKFTPIPVEQYLLGQELFTLTKEVFDFCWERNLFTEAYNWSVEGDFYRLRWNAQQNTISLNDVASDRGEILRADLNTGRAIFAQGITQGDIDQMQRAIEELDNLRAEEEAKRQAEIQAQQQRKGRGRSLGRSRDFELE